MGKKHEKVEQTDSKRRSALHWASGYGHTEVVQYLIKHKADLDAKDVNDS